jgi:hypothetical protein
MSRRSRRLALTLLALLWWLTAAVPALAEFGVEEVRAWDNGDMLVMDASIDYGFSEDALEALDNGVPLTLEVHIQVRDADAWVWDESLADQRLRYVIRYKPLSERYLVTQLPDDGGRSYVTRDAAIAALGEIEGLQLVSSERLRETGDAFEIHVKASLDIEELPLPLKPIAYLYPSWKLSSGWTKWPLTP